MFSLLKLCDDFFGKVRTVPRFDFNGNLFMGDEDVATSIGLHHHGEEPDAAGYSLQELFHMIRSNFQQHRVFGLEVLANIIEKVNILIWKLLLI